MIRKIHEGGWDFADSVLLGLMCAGYEVGRASRVLDYGCGDGRYVYRFRDLGFDAYGFEIHDRVVYRNEEDRSFFGFINNTQTDTSNTVIDEGEFILPFEDESFDLVYSTTVLEHVLNPEPAMREIARVLRPEGIALHLYPRRDAIIEPHMFVPFASRVQSEWWFRAWALLGIRNSFQIGMSAGEVAERNKRYTETGLRYHTDDEMYAYCSRYFGSIAFIDELYYATSNPKHTRQAIWQALKSDHPVWNLAAIPKLRVLLTSQKR